VRYLKSFVVGIAGAGVTAIVAFAYRVYRAFQGSGTDMGFIDFYFPKWVPAWAQNTWMEVWMWSRFNVSILLIFAAFVVSFCWEYYRLSIQPGSSPR
jgi:hypothetical protein